jgi:hypothetical protein
MLIAERKRQLLKSALTGAPDSSAKILKGPD